MSKLNDVNIDLFLKTLKETFPKETFFVATETEEPNEIFFSKEKAFASGYEYIDSFDQHGQVMVRYKRRELKDHDYEVIGP